MRARYVTPYRAGDQRSDAPPNPYTHSEGAQWNTWGPFGVVLLIFYAQLMDIVGSFAVGAGVFGVRPCIASFLHVVGVFGAKMLRLALRCFVSTHGILGRWGRLLWRRNA